MSRRPDYSNKQYVLDLLPSLGLLSVKEPLRRLLNTADVAAPKRPAEEDPVVEEPDRPDCSDQNKILSGTFSEIATSMRLLNTDDGSLNMKDVIELLFSMNVSWMEFYPPVPSVDRTMNHFCVFTPQYSDESSPGPRPTNMPMCVKNPHWLHLTQSCGDKHANLQAAKADWLGILEKRMKEYWEHDSHHQAEKDKKRTRYGITTELVDGNFASFKELVEEEVTDVAARLKEIKKRMSPKDDEVKGIGLFIGRDLPAPPGWIVYNVWKKPTETQKDAMMKNDGMWVTTYTKLDAIYCGPSFTKWDQKITDTHLYQVCRAKSPNEAWYIYLGYDVKKYGAGKGTQRGKRSGFKDVIYLTEQEWGIQKAGEAGGASSNQAVLNEIDKWKNESLRASRELREKVSNLLSEMDATQRDQAAAEDASRKLVGLGDLSSDDEDQE